MESTLTRVYYIIHRKGSESAPLIERTKLEQHVRFIAQSWEESIQTIALTRKITEQQTRLASQFPNSYRDLFSTEDAIEDAGHILSLHDKKPLFVTFYNTYNKENKVFLSDSFTATKH